MRAGTSSGKRETLIFWSARPRRRPPPPHVSSGSCDIIAFRAGSYNLNSQQPFDSPLPQTLERRIDASVSQSQSCLPPVAIGKSVLQTYGKKSYSVTEGRIPMALGNRIRRPPSTSAISMSVSPIG